MTEERQILNFLSKNLEKYNSLFSMTELVNALEKSHDTTQGPDQIHYQILKNLPPTALNCMLNIFNEIWKGGNFPPSWREAIIIPIPKPGKDDTDTANYRPIALTSCVCKTMERMINERLIWFLETSAILISTQSGFRKARSTIDHLVRLETFIREGFIKGEHVVALFFDLEKAYDTTWKYGIMRDLHKMGLRGRLPLFIDKFLTDRTFRVRIGTSYSDTYDQEMGVPQGSILSVTLFIIKINSIVDCISPDVDSSLYVDDFHICYRSRKMEIIERHIQLNLNRLQQWADENGFKFSKNKTVCMHFCHKRKAHADPILNLDGTQIPVVEQTKFLGLYFDKKLSFIPHIKYLKKKCQNALNLLKVVAHTDWGGDRVVLLQIYDSLIRSKLDYGCSVYGSARKSYIQMLDPVQNQGLRLCLGAFRTSPATSLCVEADEQPLALRREKLTLQYAIKVASTPDNPVFTSIFQPKYTALFQRKPNTIKPIGLRIQDSFSTLEFSPDLVAKFQYPQTPPWTLTPPDVNLSISNNKKADTSPDIYLSKFQEVKAMLHEHEPIYTDGSKRGDRAAAAAVMNGHAYIERLPDKASIFSAELHAVFLALDHVETSDKDKFVIFTDSQSCLQSIKGQEWKNPLVQRILERLDTLLKELNKIIVFCWIPSHIGIKGNEAADAAAKAGLDLRVTDMQLPYTDFKYYIIQYIKAKWQAEWDTAIGNKLHAVQPTLGKWKGSSRTSRREETVLSRLRIGHSRLTHSFLLRREDPPECIPCQCPLTIKHILVECLDFDQIRSRYFEVNGLRMTFASVNPSQIISYLKDIGLFHRL